jgi:biotin transport system substrate-specific component
MFFTQAAAPRVLSDALLPRWSARTLAADLLLAALFSGLVAASARLRIPLPFTPVPITGQTFAVLFTGAVLGGRRALLTLLLYLAEGAAGLPVFAGGLSGAIHLIGPTGGYLISYPLAAGCAGLLAERGWDRTPVRAACAMTLASGIIFLLGVLWLAHFVGGIGHAVTMGLLPFLPGEVIKIALAAALLPAGWQLVRMLQPK